MITIKEKTLAEEIISIVQANSTNHPAPLECTVTKNYPNDTTHVDVTTENGDLLYVPCILGNSLGSKGVVIFPNGDLTKPHAIINDTTLQTITNKLGINQPSSNKFNYAITTKTKGEITYEEYWILSNAYYDYDLERFIKIDGTHTSFGIQIQANGTYPGEAELGYRDNVGINIWRNPKKSDVYKDTSNYDYTDWETKNHIGAKKINGGSWVEYAISSGWNNSFMIDSYGGMTIGGAGFEIDGNGIFPFTRLTSSRTTINGVNYSLFGLLDNAYHAGSGCDDNSTYSWFVGMLAPIDENHLKDNTNASFVVMYNDTEYTTEANKNNLNPNNWHIVFEVNTGGVV